MGRRRQEDIVSSELAMIAQNESLARDDKRREKAVEIARASYDHYGDDLEIGDMEGIPDVESVDAGYWVQARVWVDMEEVEDACDFPEA